MDTHQIAKAAAQIAEAKLPLYQIIAPLFVGASPQAANEAFDALCEATKPPRVPIALHRNITARAFVYVLMNPTEPVLRRAAAAARFMGTPQESLPGYVPGLPRPSAPRVWAAIFSEATKPPRNAPGKYDLSDGSRITIKSAAVEGAEEICAMLRLIPRDEADARIAADRASTITEVTTL